jgi:hypothetical protein
VLKFKVLEEILVKQYKKQISIGVGALAFVLFLLQYQNCGSSSGSNGSTTVGPSGFSYSVNLQPPTNLTRNQSSSITLSVQDSGTENVIIRMGYLTGNGVRNPFCSWQNQTTPIPQLVCPNVQVNQAGAVQLYVEVDDSSSNLGQQEVLCENNTSPGCNGTYTVNVQ